MKPLAEIPRRTIEELVTLYSLEPSIVDIFVEGFSDQRFLRWFINSEIPFGNSVGIYTVDEIDVPSVLLRENGLSPGNRSEVIILCKELEAAFDAHFTRATGLIDLDLSAILPDAVVSSLVIKTDYACLESYNFSVQNIEKLRTLAFARIKIPASAIIESISPTLKYLFSVRVVNERLGTKLEWIDFSSFISIEKEQLSFRREDFIRAYLRKGGKTGMYDSFSAQIEGVYTQLTDDVRSSMNGHDAIALLGIYLRRFHKKAEDIDRTKPHILQHLLCCTAESKELRKELMFSTLTNRLGGRR